MFSIHLYLRHRHGTSLAVAITLRLLKAEIRGLITIDYKYISTNNKFIKQILLNKSISRYHICLLKKNIYV